MSISLPDPIVITNSLVKTFKGCETKTKYKHMELIGPRLQRSKPLKRGNWFHELLEAKYKGESVNEAHKRNVLKYNKLFDEEKEYLGNLPSEMARLYKSYQWHYRDDTSWKVHETEIKLEAELPNGMQAQGKADLLVEDEFGLWAVDHKTHNRLPGTNFRLLDFQSPYYIWLFRQCGIPVRGFIWNYVVPKAPEPLKFNLDGKLSKRQPAVLDYPTARRGLTEDQLAREDVQELLTKLKAVRYNRDEPQVSPVFRRDLMEKTDDMINNVIADICHTAERYVEWRERVANGGIVERTVGRNCEYCEYRTLCIAELVGLDAEGVRRREYTDHDPFEYYNPATEEV